MNISPSTSPRRLQRQRPISPLAKTQPRHINDDSDDDATPAQQPTGHEPGTFYPVSLSDGPADKVAPLPPPVQAVQGPPPGLGSHNVSRTSSPTRSQSHSYSNSYSYSPYGQSLAEASNRDDNYGYRPAYKDDAGGTTTHLVGRPLALRPANEYHNAYAGADGADGAPSPLLAGTPLRPPSSASRSSSPTSKFATISSASRAFLEHRRQHSIPNLMPTISSIGRNIGRAISPERSLQQPRRPGIPDFQDHRSSDDSDDSGDSGSSDGSYSEEDSDEEDSEDNSEEDSEDEDEDEDEPRHRRRDIMAAFTSDQRPRRAHTSSRGDERDDGDDTRSVASGFANWLSTASTGSTGGTVKARSPERPSFFANARTTTPEPSVFRPGHNTSPSARRSMSLASNASLTPRSAVLPTASSPSRFSQLATSMTATLSRLTQQSPTNARLAGMGFETDDMYNLDIHAALFPGGHPAERDAFSPAAFKNLEANAVGTLRRMQMAYQQQAVALRDTAAEKSVCDEEYEEVTTRAEHLKMQLEGMALRAAEQQKEMDLLIKELAAEKEARAHERAMLMAGAPATPTAGSVSGGASPPLNQDDERTSSIALSEDLGVDEAMRDQKHRDAWRRRSVKSNGSSVDFDCEDSSAVDEDDNSSSIFSHARSPAASTAGSVYGGSSQVHHPRVAALGSMGSMGSMGSIRQGARSASSSSTATIVSQSQPLTKLQKLMRNVTAAIKDEEPELGNGLTSCSNCAGQDVSFAWNTVSVLRDENKHLKQRVGQLEVAVEGALDFVNGVGL